MNPFQPDAINDFEEVIHAGPFPIRFPKAKVLEQDEEWCEVKVDDSWKKIRFHDYNEVYRVPGLYETIFYRTLRCNSPNRISSVLSEVLTEQGIQPEGLRILDFGAGNGMAGEALQTLGARKIVGVDILPEARDATVRDRCWVYEHYKVSDFTQLSPQEIEFYKSYSFNTLVTVAALGFGDIPPLAFKNAFNFIANEGFLAFNIRDIFLRSANRSPFSHLVHSMIEQEVIEIQLFKRYRHRLSVAGQPIYYVAIVARKLRDIPDEMLT